jgi:hypothetical protein
MSFEWSVGNWCKILMLLICEVILTVGVLYAVIICDFECLKFYFIENSFEYPNLS